MQEKTAWYQALDAKILAVEDGLECNYRVCVRLLLANHAGGPCIRDLT